MKNIRNKTRKDIEKELADLRKGLQQFRFGMTGSKTRDVKEARSIRREIARLLTEIRRRQLSGEER